MKLQYLRAFIVLLAGLVALIANMRAHRDVTVSLLIVLIVIIVFYFIGTLMVELIDRAADKKPDNNLKIIGDEEEELTETEEVHVSFDEEDDEEVE